MNDLSRGKVLSGRTSQGTMVAFAFLLSVSVAGADSWSQWRGPQRDATLRVPGMSWLDSISGDSLQKAWSVELGEGYASPILRDGKVFTVETKDKKVEITRAFQALTGEPVWDRTWEGAMKVPFFASKNGSWVRSTPAVDGSAIYVGGIRDVLVAMDPASGEERWRVDFSEREGTELPAFGFASSPLLDGDSIYVQAGCAVAKLRKDTGETVWRALEDRQAMFGSAFSSPLIGTLHGQRQLVAQTRRTLAGVDLETGEVLWSTPVKAFRGMNILTPLLLGNRVFTATYGGGSFLYEVTRSEQGEWGVQEIWSQEKIEGYMASPVLVGDHAYLLARNKKLYSLNLAEPQVNWTSKETFGEYWSMIANGNRILALDQRGELILFAADPESFQVLDRREVSQEPTWAHLAVEGEHLYVRGLRSLTAYRWNQPQARQAGAEEEQGPALSLTTAVRPGSD